MDVVARHQLARQLADMDLDEVNELRDQEIQRRTREAQRQKRGKMADDFGTIRYDKDNGTLWVRSAGYSWEPYVHDNHGVGVQDWDLDPDEGELPVVGTMPEQFNAREAAIHAEEFADEGDG